MREGVTKRDVWDDWISEYVDTSEPVPLFATDDSGRVRIGTHGTDDRPILQRSQAMETLLATEGRKVVVDWQEDDDTYEGVIYLMYTLDGDEVVPRYVGKAGKYGRDGDGLSSNLKNVSTNRSKFARWGDGYAYHLGELSNALLAHHDDDSLNQESSAPLKYQQWADALFENGTRLLREPVYFWARAWRVDDTGPFYDFETKLEALEYYLIDLAASLYPESLLNSDGT